MNKKILGIQFAWLLEGWPIKGIAAFVTLISLLGGGLYYLSVKQTDVEGGRCKVTCAAEGKLFVYVPDQMTDGYPYSKPSPNCSCYGSLIPKDAGVK